MNNWRSCRQIDNCRENHLINRTKLTFPAPGSTSSLKERLLWAATNWTYQEVRSDEGPPTNPSLVSCVAGKGTSITLNISLSVENKSRGTSRWQLWHLSLWEVLKNYLHRDRERGHSDRHIAGAVCVCLVGKRRKQQGVHFWILRILFRGENFSPTAIVGLYLKATCRRQKDKSCRRS